MEYVALAFAYVCPMCGTLDADVELENEFHGVGPDNGKSRSAPQQISLTAKQVASAVRDNKVQVTELEKLLDVQHVRNLVHGILGHFASLNLTLDVNSLLLRWIAMREEKSRSIDTAKVVAACFAVLKEHMPLLTIEEVCTLSNVSEFAAKKALQSIEDELSRTVARDTPMMHIDRHITFLLDVERNSTQQAHRSAIPDQVHLLHDAKIDSQDFRKKSQLLTSLCVRNGLYNRSAARGQTMDLGLCAFAILMHCIEAQAGKKCSQTWFAELAVKAPGWRAGQKMVGLSKEELGLANDEYDGRAGGTYDRDIVQSTTKTIRETVKRRYVEISRLLSVYIRVLPWYDEGDDKSTRQEEYKMASRGKLHPNVKVDVVSIRPVQRSKIVRYTNDVLLLSDALHAKVDTLLNEKIGPTFASTPWSRFWATELQFNNVRQTASGRAEIEQKELLAQSQDSDSTRLLLRNRIMTSLAALDLERKSRVHTTFTVDLLEQMDGEMVDRTLFMHGEMESYLRTPAEVQQRRRLLDDTNSPAEQDEAHKRKLGHAYDTQINPDAQLRSLASGKRTKALDEADVERIISQL
jgi:hypothetical protein